MTERSNAAASRASAAMSHGGAASRGGPLKVWKGTRSAGRRPEDEQLLPFRRSRDAPRGRYPEARRPDAVRAWTPLKPPAGGPGGEAWSRMRMFPSACRLVSPRPTSFLCSRVDYLRMDEVAGSLPRRRARPLDRPPPPQSVAGQRTLSPRRGGETLRRRTRPGTEEAQSPSNAHPTPITPRHSRPLPKGVGFEKGVVSGIGPAGAARGDAGRRAYAPAYSCRRA